MKLIRKNKKGFTLVELIVVIAILAILALILIPAISGYVTKAEKSKDEANARALYSAANFELYTRDEVLPTDGDLETAIADAIGGDLDKGATVTVEIEDGILKSVTYTSAKGKSTPWPKAEPTETP